MVVAFDGSLQASHALMLREPRGSAWIERSMWSASPRSTTLRARHADRAVEFLASHDIKAEPTAIASSEDPAAVLLKQAREFSAGLIVMGVYGQPLMREFLLGSTTRTI